MEEWVIDLFLEFPHGLEKSFSGFEEFRIVRQVGELVRIRLEVVEFEFRWIDIGRIPECLRNRCVCVAGDGCRIRRSYRIVNQLIAFVADPECQVQNVRRRTGAEGVNVFPSWCLGILQRLQRCSH
jgi:hypothetical protein